MKKTLFVFVSVFALSAAAQASTDLLPFLAEEAGTAGPSYYDQLMTKYDQAATPSESPIGWWSGRCYAMEAPNTATSGLFVGVELSKEKWNELYGPLFPTPAGHLTAMAMIGRPGSSTATDFDEMTPSLRSQLTSYLGSVNLFDFRAEVADGGLTTSYPQGGVYYRTRTFNDFILSKLVVMKDSTENDSNGKPTFRAGDTIEICYYFKKVN